MKTLPRKSGLPFVLLISVAAVAGIAQTSSNSNGPATAAQSVQPGGAVTSGVISFTGPVTGSPFEPVTGRPYSAEQVTDHLQTLPDGTHIAQTTQKLLLYRDSEGRTRTEHYFADAEGSPMASSPNIVEITDPVAGYRYAFDKQSHVVRRTPWPPTMHRLSQASTSAHQTNTNTSTAAGAVQGTPSATAAAVRPRPELKRESLGTQTIDGLVVEGTRTTTTFQEGIIGNDRAFTTVYESWTSRDLKLLVLSKRSDPRSGDLTTKLTNISQSEPDPDLFQAPAGYSIADQQ